MDAGSLEKIIEKREKHYIWLESELKYRIGIGAAVIAVFFLWLRWMNPKMHGWWGMLLAAEAIGLAWNYMVYRMEYNRYLTLAQHLQALEEENYDYSESSYSMNTGIYAQLMERLEGIGRKFATLKERLVREKESTKELVTDLSHQLKTPAAALDLSLALLLDADTTEEERTEFLQRSQKEMKKLRELLEALLRLSQLEAGTIQIQPVLTSLKETLIRAVNGVWLKANEKEIELEMEEFTDVRFFHDSRWTAEAFSNVIDNAIKYSTKGSHIRLRVEQRISYVFIEVEDEGIGIAPEEALHVFKRFYRGSRPEVVSCEGAGVGLYLVRQILEAQGGSIRVIPAREKGSIFQMTLPLV